MSTTYSAEREFKMRDDETIDGVGVRRADKDDFKRQNAEARSGVKQQMDSIRAVAQDKIAQAQQSDLGQKAAVQGHIVADRMRQLGEAGVAKAKEAVQTGKIKLNEMQQQSKPVQAPVPPPAEQLQLQPGAALSADSSMPSYSPVEADQRRVVKATSTADASFSSIPDSGASSVTQAKPISEQPIIEQRIGGGVRDEETEPLLVKQASSSGGMSDVGGVQEGGPIPLSLLDQGTSGDPLPATVDQSSKGADWDGIKETAIPQVQKAKSLYSIWKAEDNTQCAEQTAETGKPVQQQASEMYTQSVKPALASAASQAQTLYTEQLAPLASSTMAKVSTVFNESVQPALSATLAAAQEQAGVIREEGLGVTMDKAGKAYQRRVAGAKQSVISTYEEKVPLEQRQKLHEVKSGVMANLRLGWNKALDVWEAQEPTLRAWTNRAIQSIKRNKLELPLLFLGTLIALWAAMSLLGWAAFPNKSHGDALPALYQPHLQQSTGPILGANLPTVSDKIKMKLDDADDKLRDAYGSLRDSGAQQLRDMKHGVDDVKSRVSSSIPSTAEMKGRAADAKDRAADMKDRAADSMPDVDRIRGRVAHQAGDLKERIIDGASDIQDRVIDTSNDLKERIVDGAADIQERVIDTSNDLKERSADLKDRMTGTSYDVKERVADGASDIKGRVINGAERVIDGIKQQAADLKGRVAGGIDSARAAMPSMPDTQTDTSILTHLPTDQAAGIAEGDLALKLKDRMHHAAHAIPDGLRELRAKAAGIKDTIVDKLNSAAQPAPAPMHTDVLDPDQHVVEEMDSHHHVKESIQV